MKFLTFVTTATLITVSYCSVIHKRAGSSSHSKESSISTVYSFLGASGTDTNVLQLPSSTMSLESQASSSIDESSALSQFLNGALASATGTAAATQTALPTASGSSDEASAASTDGEQMLSASGSIASTSMISYYQQSSAPTGSSSSFVTIPTAATSSGNSSTIASGGANVLDVSLLAGGIAGIVALVI